MSTFLSVTGLSVSYGGHDAVRDLAMEISTGGVTALIGANGAGKSTTIKAIAGLLQHDGTVILADEDISDFPAEQRARAGIGYSPEGRRVFGGMTVRENLEVACRGNRAERQRRIEEAIRMFPELAAHLERRAWELSGGQQQMLAIGRARMNSPKLLLLDEPFTGLAPILAKSVAREIARAARLGTSILLADLPGGYARTLCDHAIILRRGAIVAAGAPGDLDQSAAWEQAIRE